jgi:hypothetical protein
MSFFLCQIQKRLAFLQIGAYQSFHLFPKLVVWIPAVLFQRIFRRSKKRETKGQRGREMDGKCYSGYVLYSLSFLSFESFLARSDSVSQER